MFVLGVLSGAVIAYLAILWLIYEGGPYPTGGSMELSGAEVNATSSPDGDYLAKAERRTYRDGRCENRTTVTRSATEPDWERKYVFNIGCSNPMGLEWTGDRKLLIRYGYDNNGEVHVSRQFVSPDVEVAIEYFLEQ